MSRQPSRNQENEAVSRTSQREEVRPASQRSQTGSRNGNVATPVNSHHSQRASPVVDRQSQNATPVKVTSGSRVPSVAQQQSHHSQANINGAVSQISLRSQGSEVMIPAGLDDTPRYNSARDRELINKSRNGFIGTTYIADVKTYFDHSSFDGNVTETNKKYLEDLLSDFRKLLRNTLDDEHDTLHDVEFVDNEIAARALPGHQQLLTARSATFEALFKRLNNGDSEYLGFRLLSDSDNRVRRILLPQEGPRISYELMEASLHYMYWGNIDERLSKQEDSLKEFFEVASFLDLKELRRHLAEELYQNLKSRGSTRLAIEYLKLSVKCGCKYLKREVIGYIVKYKKQMLKDKAWSMFIEEKDHRELVKEIYQNMVEKSSSE